MKTYSKYFATLFEGALSPHTSFTVFRLQYPALRNPTHQDFAVIWDDDHDERVIWVAEQLAARGLMYDVLLIAEHKGTVSFLTGCKTSALNEMLEAICNHIPGDMFGCESTFDLEDGTFKKGLAECLVRTWDLRGGKPAEFSETTPRMNPHYLAPIHDDESNGEQFRLSAAERRALREVTK